MQLLGVGIDIVDIERVRTMRFLDRAAEFLLVDQELREMRESRDMAQYFASRLAAKEAVLKASPEPLTYHDVTVEKKDDRPQTRITGRGKVLLSIAHEFRYAVAHATVYLE